MADASRTPRPRTVRIPDEIWEAAQAVARSRGEDLSTVLRQELLRYNERNRKSRADNAASA